MKIKEKIKKIGNRKYCLLLALLILALLFTTLIPKINLGTQKASALSAPQIKTLDLNGQSYSYQTSLNELRNNYNVLNQNYFNNLFILQEDTEGENHCTLFSTTGLMSDEQNTKIKNILDDNITFYKDGNKLVNEFIYDTQNATDYPPFTFGEVENNNFKLSDVTSIELNLNNIYNNALITSYVSEKSNSLFIQFLYFKKEFDYQDINNEIMYENSISNFYSLSKAINYNFNILTSDEYYLKAVGVFFEDSLIPYENLEIRPSVLNSDILNYQQTEMYSRIYLFPNNIHFIDNNEANIISFNAETDFDNQYKGNYLLSSHKFDETLYNKLKPLPYNTEPIVQSLGDGVYFGGKVGTNERVTNIYYKNAMGHYGLICTSDPTIGDDNTPSPLLNSLFWKLYAGENKTYYTNQNQLIYLDKPLNLTIDNTNYTGDGLSAQIADALYNVQYIGETDKIQKEQEIQKDFENMLYVTGAFAVIGLLLGFVFGNPILGLVIGAIVGFGLTIIPIILDGLQAIFGQQFLDGIQNFFRTIASLIANVVSSILNFLFGIITNPAVLVLVLIVAILYLFVFRNKE